MQFEQFYLSCLAHASYLIGSEGVAAVVDPQRDVDLYLDEAARLNLKIGHVIETHLHADFVSGHKELAARTGATIHLGAAGGAEFLHNGVKDGDEIRFGKCVLRFLETPGHTPESICVLVTDLDRSPGPWAVLTGDTLFIGEVGRPDLVPGHTPEEMAGSLYDSLHNKLLTLPDAVEVYPAHGAGSLCGRNISSESSSTIGEQRKNNYALQPMSREEFVNLVAGDIPPRPAFFFRDAKINKAGAPALADLPPLNALAAKAVESKQASGAVVLDTRPATAFGAGHLPGAINIPLSGQFATWAGTLIGLDVPIIFVAEDAERLEESRIRLARVGIENITGYLEGGMEAWTKAGLPVKQISLISVQELNKQISDSPGGIQVVDARNPGEWDAGHIEQASLHTLDHLPAPAIEKEKADPLSGLDPAKPVAVHCKGGYRSSIAVSLLERAGFTNLQNVSGGFDAWMEQKLPFQAEQNAQSCAT